MNCCVFSLVPLPSSSIAKDVWALVTVFEKVKHEYSVTDTQFNMGSYFSKTLIKGQVVLL